ncbi:MAG: hypothetical protein WBD86_00900 [Microgenomates group bacterium]
MTEERESKSENIIKLLAEHIGVEESELSKKDSFADDLHMSAADFTDFIEKLSGAGFNTSSLDLSKTETVGELIEEIISEEELE